MSQLNKIRLRILKSLRLSEADREGLSPNIENTQIDNEDELGLDVEPPQLEDTGQAIPAAENIEIKNIP